VLAAAPVSPGNFMVGDSGSVINVVGHPAGNLGILVDPEVGISSETVHVVGIAGAAVTLQVDLQVLDRCDPGAELIDIG